jgi:hypothetical protein
MTALLGQTASVGQKTDFSNENTDKRDDEIDLQERSTKKKKEGDHEYNNLSSLPKDYSDAVDMQTALPNGGSYRDTVLGTRQQAPTGGKEDEEEEEEGEAEVDEEESERMKVEERTIDDYECPEFIFSKQEEKRLYRPWRRGVVVKLLGRRIGYKALETRLKQMWVRRGVINIIDLSNDYYLVAFSHEEDQYSALMDEPWFIYDHYLTVKEWSPNFHPASDTIKEVAVWLRISGLPIEYYDSRALKFIGNRVGKTVKVDKNTLSQERGKYARLCVQVNLSKPLLAMFTIKGRKYDIEYEGLHMLCTKCGRYGHYKEGCPEKVKADEAGGVGKKNEGSGKATDHLADSSGDGPWRVVQKTRRNKKVNNGRNGEPEAINAPPAKVIAPTNKINADANPTGSRFISLVDEEMDLEEERIDVEANNQVQEKECEDIPSGNSWVQPGNHQRVKNKRTNGGAINRRGDGMVDRPIKESKLATRVGSFKGRGGSQGKKGVENIVEKMGVELLENVLDNQPKVNNSSNDGKKIQSDRNLMDPGPDVSFSSTPLINPNVPRPPNWVDTPQ